MEQAEVIIAGQRVVCCFDPILRSWPVDSEVLLDEIRKQLAGAVLAHEMREWNDLWPRYLKLHEEGPLIGTQPLVDLREMH